MAKALSIVNGLPVMTDIVASAAPADDTRLLVVLGAPSNGNEITGPIVAGTNITIPDSLSYQSGELQVTLNGQVLLPVTGFTEVGSGDKTQIQLARDLEIDDELGFRID